MDDYFMVRRHVPAFGSWDSGEYLPFTECFESARQGGLLRYTCHGEDQNVGDLCVAGDLYQNDVVMPAMIVVQRSQSKFMRPAADGKQTKMKKQGKWDTGHPNDAHHHSVQAVAPSPARFSKPVDEDLYKISPEHLRNNGKKKRGLGFFAGCCLVPTGSM